MIFEQIRAGGDRNFAYLIGDENSRQALIVDPASDPAKVMERVAFHGLKVLYLVNTHTHHDHIAGNDHILSETDAKLLSGAEAVRDGETLALGAVSLTFLHTPGHTPESLCLLATEGEAPGHVVTGDTLFVGKVGGTGFGDDARAEYDSLHKKLLTLPDATRVWPGHDYGAAPDSTIGNERETNPFLERDSFEGFVDLKRNWLAYKEKHGIK
jgi:hydroxyacylglutathione hydrolase